MGLIALSDTTFDRLSALALEDRVSLDEEAERLLLIAIEQRTKRLSRVAELERIAAMTPKDAVHTDSVILLREDRDR
jgi:hypothetical protein